MTALHDCSKAENVYQLFTQVDQPTAKMLAYKGALEAIMTKTTRNVFKKLSYLNDSENTFEKAISMAPNDLEVRFMRLAVEHEIPRFLGMSDHIEEDIEFIVKNLSIFKPNDLPYSVRREIIGFAKQSGYFTNSEIAVFEMVMANKN